MKKEAIETVKLEDLKIKDRKQNVRFHPRKQIEEYCRSLEMFGQTKNAVIDEDNNVLIGNGLCMAALELGWTEITTLRRIDLTAAQKKKLMISDNKIFSLGIDNMDVIEAFFEELTGDLEIPGYDADILKSMAASAEEITKEISKQGILSSQQIEEINGRPEPSTLRLTREEIPEQSSESSFTIKHGMPITTPSVKEESNSRIVIQCAKCGDNICLSKDRLLQLM